MVLADPSDAGEAQRSPIDELIETLQADLAQTERDQRDTARMVQQSRQEVEKATQRNATIASHLRQIQGNLEAVPRADIKRAYEAAQEAQQRLFAMRGQVEKLQTDQTNLERWAEHLRRTLEKLEAGSAPAGRAETGEAADSGKPMVVRIVEAQESERQRLARQIHDGPAQALSNFILQTEIATKLFERDPERAKGELANLKTSAKNTFDGIRDFIFDLRPMMLDDLGLVPTVRRYVDTFREKSGLQTTLTITGAERRLESVREVMVFRGVQELLGNVRNHAQATQVRVSLDVDDKRVRLVVEDNGRGFDPATVLNGHQKTIGLTTMQERIELIGGQVQIDSQPGQGARITMEVPVGGPVALL
jgi:two-component system, NarL family, sensor histidine kinase DegS